jgi:hypothetical protein
MVWISVIHIYKALGNSTNSQIPSLMGNTESRKNIPSTLVLVEPSCTSSRTLRGVLEVAEVEHEVVSVRADALRGHPKGHLWDFVVIHERRPTLVESMSD